MIHTKDVNQAYVYDENGEPKCNRSLFQSLATDNKQGLCCEKSSQTDNLHNSSEEQQQYLQIGYPFLLLQDNNKNKQQSYLNFYSVQQPSCELIEKKEIPEQPKKLYRCETKNLPKNFGKGILNFIQKNTKKVNVILKECKLGYKKFLMKVREQKKNIRSILDLRNLWTDQKFGKVFRILSNIFFRSYSLEYIFNSKISNINAHLKYRMNLKNGLSKPYDFNHIKNN